MADQDHDGSHIKGLIINLFDHFWPNLLRNKDVFIGQFRTPITKAFHKKKGSVPFYSLGEYEQWRNGPASSELKQWRIKYYKGLGTSTAAEAREYFSSFDAHVSWFEPASEQDIDSIDKAFSKSRASNRREWITHAGENTVRLLRSLRGSGVIW